MQLLLRRGQTEGLLKQLRYVLWVKYELTPQEKALVEKYRPHKAVLSPGDTKDAIRSWRRAIIYGGILAGIACLIAMANLSLSFLGLGILVVGWPLLTYLIHNQIREAILVGDVLNGRIFKSPNIMALMDKEHAMREMAVEFRHFIEGMKTWSATDEPEVIPIELDQGRKLRELETSYGNR